MLKLSIFISIYLCPLCSLEGHERLHDDDEGMNRDEGMDRREGVNRYGGREEVNRYGGVEGVNLYGGREEILLQPELRSSYSTG